jgi:hypothetical protein
VANVLSTVGFVAVLVLLVWLGWRYEPHWCAKDGRRFTARTRPLITDDHLRADARRSLESPAPSMFGMFGALGGGGRSSSMARQWRDARVFVDDDDTVQLITRVGAIRRPLPPVKVIGKGESTSKHRVVYLIGGDPLRELRVPATSRAVPVLDELVARATGHRPPG